jgi:hypothetical protein
VKVSITFTTFSSKTKGYDIIRNENGIGIPVISEAKIYDREHIDNDRNGILKNNKYVKP